MMPLSTEERRALAILAALLGLSAGARWVNRPAPLLQDAPALDLAALEEASRDAKDGGPSAARGVAGASSASARAPARIDPNTATAQELERLPRVGAALAARIIEERERAPFTTVTDLQRVRGIGPAMATALAERVTLPAGGGSAGSAGPAASPGARPAVNSAATRAQPPTQPMENTAPARAPPTAAAPAGPVDLNRATARELEAIRGVGPALGARIVARRDSLGRFRNWDDVDAVSGVGPALLERLRAASIIR